MPIIGQPLKQSLTDKEAAKGTKSYVASNAVSLH